MNHFITKRIVAVLVAILLTTLGVLKVLNREPEEMEGCIVEVINVSDSRIGTVQLVGLDDAGVLGPLLKGESKRIHLNSEQAEKSISLAFGFFDELEHHCGWSLKETADVGGKLIKLEINSDNSVTMWSEQL